MGKKNKDRFENVPLREQIKPIFKERFLEMFNGDLDEYNKFIETILLPQRKSFRVNTYKIKKIDEFINNLNKKNIKTIPVPWCENGFFLEFSKKNRSDLGNLFEHFLGEIYVQEATSMCPAELLDIPKNINNNFMVLDMCSAPGSKTTQIANLMQNKGILIANELDYKRLGPLKINLERSGFSNIVITNNDGNRILGENIFDRICLDAPCSGSGVIRKSPNTIKKYNPKKLKGIKTIQLKLLQRAVELLKVDGIMTYSTCSLDPEENELLIKEFLEKNDNIELLKAELPGLILTNKLKKFQESKIPEVITKNTIRIWPQDNDTNGFYIAKLKKIK